MKVLMKILAGGVVAAALFTAAPAAAQYYPGYPYGGGYGYGYGSNNGYYEEEAEPKGFLDKLILKASPSNWFRKKKQRS